MKKTPLLMLSTLLVLLTVFLYHPALRYHFFQDDFYTLFKSQATTLGDTTKFFLPSGEIYYRPLSMRLYFWAIQSLFGLNPRAFHLLSLLIHLANGFLVWKLIAKLMGNSRLGWIVATLYSTSAIHFISLFWISEVGLLLGISFYLLCCNLFLSFIDTHQPKLKFLLIVSFILGLLSHEYLVTLPVVLVGLGWYKKNSLSKIFQTTWPLGLITGIYLLLRLVIFPLPATGTYATAFNKASLQALFWYGVWSLNILENIKDQLEPGLKLNQTFLYDYPTLNLEYLTTLILAVVFLLSIPLVLYFNSRFSHKQFIRRLISLCLFWMAATLSLPLITPYHLYPLYASLFLVGLLTALTSAIWYLYRWKKLAITLLLLFWITLSWQTLRLTEKIHWTVQEAKRVQETLTKLNQLYSHILPGSTIAINQDYQIEQALYGDLGLKMLLSDSTLKTYYGSPESIAPQSCTMEKDMGVCLTRHNIFVLTN